MNSAISILSEELKLPCGAVLPNRICKAAMTEGLADPLNQATPRLAKLYEVWAGGGAGLLISGNVIVDRWHLERPGNVAIVGEQSEAQLEGLRAIARAGTKHGSHFWVQLNHAGRQTQKIINKHPKAPSDVGLKMGNGRFGTPTPMTEDEVQEVVDGFIHAARISHETGFTGVQIHAAHGYLNSQFLSPLSNKRKDKWGGDTLENRSRFLLEIVRGTREAMPADFAVSVKLNSADFQKGGFSEDESVEVAKLLEAAGVDLIEISGGNYEQPRMIDFDRKDPLARDGGEKRESTRKREAYFMDFVPKLREAISIPVMVTGGFRNVDTMADAVTNDGVDVIGLGRPFCLDPHIGNKILAGEITSITEPDLRVGSGLLGPNSAIGFLRDLNAWSELGWYYEQIYNIADGKPVDMNLSGFRALLAFDRTEGKRAKALVR